MSQCLVLVRIPAELVLLPLQSVHLITPPRQSSLVNTNLSGREDVDQDTSHRQNRDVVIRDQDVSKIELKFCICSINISP